MRKSESLNEIATALAKAQGEIKHAIKDKDNPFFKSTYADLAAVKDACQTQLSEAGIAVVQAPSTNDDGSVTVTTMFLHSSGQWIETDMTAKALADNKGNITAQALGSVVTYLRRYTLSGMANVATEDDDGEGASGRSKSDGEKVQVTGKQPDRIEIEPADITVADEFWDRPNLGLAGEPGWKIGDWLAAFAAYMDQAPTEQAAEQFWADNEEKVFKLSAVRQYYCRECYTARMAADVTMAG